MGLLGPENEGIIVLWNYGIYFTSDTASHVKRLQYPVAPLWDSQLLLTCIILVCVYVLKHICFIAFVQEVDILNKSVAGDEMIAGSSFDFHNYIVI